MVPLPRDPFTQAAFHRRKRLRYDKAGHTATFITPEDIVVAKLLAFRETGSDRHLRDARGVLATQWGKIDLEEVKRRARAVGLLELLGEVIEAAQRGMESGE